MNQAPKNTAARIADALTITTVAILTSAVTALGLPAQADVAKKVARDSDTKARISDSTLKTALRKFDKLRDRDQKSVLESVRAAVAKIDDPYLRSLSEAAARAGKKSKPRHKSLRVGSKYRKSETAKRTPSALVDMLPFKSMHEYQWAFGHIEPHAVHYGKKRISKRKRQRMDIAAQLADLCQGFPLDADKALASILRDLDNERSADKHAVFLESWKNGEETFYQALARTAGTTNDIFCYDAMLFSWVKTCVDKKHPDRKGMIKSLHATQKAFYQMARTYRAYRGLREMIALSLILPPEQRLPAHLSRLYENTVGGPYSTRDNVILLLAAHDGDVDATVQTILNKLEKMPADTWRSGFRPEQGIYAAFRDVMPKLIAGGGHTDHVLAKKKKMRAQLQDEVAQVARQALVAALIK